MALACPRRERSIPPLWAGGHDEAVGTALGQVAYDSPDTGQGPASRATPMGLPPRLQRGVPVA